LVKFGYSSFEGAIRSLQFSSFVLVFGEVTLAQLLPAAIGLQRRALLFESGGRRTTLGHNSAHQTFEPAELSLEGDFKPIELERQKEMNWRLEELDRFWPYGKQSHGFSSLHVPARNKTPQCLAFESRHPRLRDLHDALEGFGLSSESENPRVSPTFYLRDPCVDTDPSVLDIPQVDGQSDSKLSGLRSRFRRHRIASQFRKLQKEEEEEEQEQTIKVEDEAADDDDPMRMISPRPTDISTPAVRPRHSFSLKRRSRDHRSGSSGGRASLPRDEDAETAVSPTGKPVNSYLDETIPPRILSQAIEQKVLKQEPQSRTPTALTEDRNTEKCATSLSKSPIGSLQNSDN
jgi:hypothetical protein